MRHVVSRWFAESDNRNHCCRSSGIGITYPGIHASRAAIYECVHVMMMVQVRHVGPPRALLFDEVTE